MVGMIELGRKTCFLCCRLQWPWFYLLFCALLLSLISLLLLLKIGDNVSTRIWFNLAPALQIVQFVICVALQNIGFDPRETFCDSESTCIWVLKFLVLHLQTRLLEFLIVQCFSWSEGLMHRRIWCSAGFAYTCASCFFRPPTFLANVKVTLTSLTSLTIQGTIWQHCRLRQAGGSS